MKDVPLVFHLGDSADGPVLQLVMNRNEAAEYFGQAIKSDGTIDGTLNRPDFKIQWDGGPGAKLEGEFCVGVLLALAWHMTQSKAQETAAKYCPDVATAH